jgi:glycosyltransferase involved in cell wall biosynthesis
MNRYGGTHLAKLAAKAEASYTTPSLQIGSHQAMKATVILPCYNSESTIGLQMDALARQTWREDWEFILADNGSTDRSVEIVESYSDRIPNMRILNVYSGDGPREPASASYNKAFRAAQSDIFITCESDDEAADGWLINMVEAMQDADFVGSAIDDYKLNEGLIRPGDGMQSPKAGFPNFSGPLFLPYAVGCTIGLSRKLWETVGDFDVEIGHLWDIDYSWRAQLAGFELKFVPDALMHYRQRTSFKARYKQGRMYGLCSARIAAKYGARSVFRYVGYNLYQLTVGSFLLATSIFPGTRPARHRIWLVANAIGQLQGVGRVIKGRRKVIEIPEHLKPLTVRKPRHERDLELVEN